MITGDIIPNSGEIYLNGFNMELERYRVNGQIGYCPQYDALLDFLSCEEHLALFAGIKGFPYHHR